MRGFNRLLLAWPLVTIPAVMVWISLGHGARPQEGELGVAVGCYRGGGFDVAITSDRQLISNGETFKTSGLFEENHHYWIKTTPYFDVRQGAIVKSFDLRVEAHVEVFVDSGPWTKIRLWGTSPGAGTPWLAKYTCQPLGA